MMMDSYKSLCKLLKKGIIMIQISLGWIDDDDNSDYNDLPWVALCYPRFPCVTLGYAA